MFGYQSYPRNSYSPQRNKFVRKSIKPATTHEISRVFAAAVMAQNINGEYVNRNWYAKEGQELKPLNTRLMMAILKSENNVPASHDEAVLATLKGKNVTITEADIEAGQVVRNHYLCYMGQLLDDSASDFTKSLVNAATLTEAAEFSGNFGLIAFMAGGYTKDIARLEAQDKKETLLIESVPLKAAVNDNLSLTIEITSVFYSNKYFRYGINAKTVGHADFSMVFFMFATALEVGKTYHIKARVKKTAPNQTQLNYVTIKA